MSAFDQLRTLGSRHYLRKMKTVARVTLFSFAALTSGSGSWAACTMPSAQSLLGRDMAGCCNVISKPFSDRRMWTAVSWEGPVGGRLYVLNCDGSKVAEASSLGYIERLEAAPPVGGMPTIAVTYIPGAGTGIKLRSVALVQIRANQLNVLWKHAVLDAAYIPSMGVNYEQHTSWHFLDGHRRIEANTVRVSPPETSRNLILPAERYCLRTSVGRYIPCQ
jgi:hypothetical protein